MAGEKELPHLGPQGLLYVSVDWVSTCSYVSSERHTNAQTTKSKAPNIGSTCFFDEMGLAVHRHEWPGQITTFQVRTKELFLLTRIV